MVPWRPERSGSFHFIAPSSRRKPTYLATLTTSTLQANKVVSTSKAIMAGSTKRMSAEEKRQTILKIYHQSKEVFTEKEIVVLASKAGVNANT